MHSVIQCEMNCKFITTFPCPRVYEFDLKHSIHQSNKMTRQRNCGGEDEKQRRGSTDTETPVGSTWPACPNDTVNGGACMMPRRFAGIIPAEPGDDGTQSSVVALPWAMSWSMATYAHSNQRCGGAASHTAIARAVCSPFARQPQSEWCEHSLLCWFDRVCHSGTASSQALKNEVTTVRTVTVLITTQAVHSRPGPLMVLQSRRKRLLPRHNA